MRRRSRATLRRLLAPAARRLDARIVRTSETAIDARVRAAVGPLQDRIDMLTAQGLATRDVFIPPLPRPDGAAFEAFMTASTCTAADFLHPRFAEITAMWATPPRFHRKLWEHVFIVHHLAERGMLRAGVRGLGFGVGAEALPAVFAAAGCGVTATDAPADVAATGWTESGQFAGGRDALANPDLVDPVRFRELVDYRTVDMNAIDADLTGFDFAWSACCLEHLGSLRHGLDFVINSTERCLRPGGIGVHTTEFNLSSNDETLERPEISFYRRRDLDWLVDELARRGHRVDPIVVAEDTTYLDGYVDVPPYHNDLHLKIAAGGYTITSLGIVVERGGA